MKASNSELFMMIYQVKSWMRTTYSWVSEIVLIDVFPSFVTELTVSRAKTEHLTI
ncbi:hypothetical protein SAMN04488062_12144 [Flavobacterium omnivorum]|uniref:Uncharacterized protein n=1 Tax=Flavobacterium omnivorum TaxID=178355 RepID=A0A1G8HHL4_9FLAO|nr:hypothetical protein SAMN04488062_12144 [Flavobacterium omnivorum]